MRSYEEQAISVLVNKDNLNKAVMEMEEKFWQKTSILIGGSYLYLYSI
jgi:hypothetical protein